MSGYNMWEKTPSDIIDRTPNKKYERFVSSATRNFIKDFKHNFPAHISPVKKITKWLVMERNIPLIKNILINAIENAIVVEDLKILTEENENKMKEYDKMIKNAKEDLKFINGQVDIKADEDLEYG